jgi:uncharacterized membrane protein YjgN (DUF898 family)
MMAMKMAASMTFIGVYSHLVICSVSLGYARPWAVVGLADSSAAAVFHTAQRFFDAPKSRFGG